MTISVLMSVYKSEKPDYLERALRSVWDDQELKPNELVIIQDGPVGEDLAAVLNRWQERHGNVFTLLRNEQNVGLTKSLNKGISVIKNDLIARMDSDDISAPTRFKEQVEYLEAHPEVSVVGGSLQEFNTGAENLGVRTYPLTHEDAMKYMFKASPFAHPAVMMRRSMFDKVKYDERFRMSQDIALWYDAVCAGFKFGNIPSIALYFRRDGDVFRRRARAKAWNEFKIYMNGIRRVYGPVTYKYVYAISRLTFRLMPVWIVKMVYGSKARTKFLQKK